jgi:hypothetical protein
MGTEKIHQELMNTLGDNAYGLSQIKIWFQRFTTVDLSCMTFLVRDNYPSLWDGR